MTNKPVAYRWKSDLGYIYDIYDHGNGEPLYTHPAKTLTDEEIDDALSAAFNRGAMFGYAEGLKKASEK